jgi:hypothetical protein
MVHFRNFWNAVNTHFQLEHLLRRVTDSRVNPHYQGFQLLNLLFGAFCWGFKSLLQLERTLRNPHKNGILKWLARLSSQDKPTADTLKNYASAADPEPLRDFLCTIWHRLRAMKAVTRPVWIALDGTGLSQKRKRPDGPVLGVAAMVVNDLINGTLNFYRRPGNQGKETGELTVAYRLVEKLATEFSFLNVAGVVVDALYCNGPFFRRVRDKGWHVVCRLKREDMIVFQDAYGLLKDRRFFPLKTATFSTGTSRCRWEYQEVADLETFPGLEEAVRVIRLFQTPLTKQGKPTGKTEELWVVTTLTLREADALAVLQVMRSRWDIEVDGFRDLKRTMHLHVIATTEPRACEVLWLVAMITQLLLNWFLSRRLRDRFPMTKARYEVFEDLWYTARMMMEKPEFL